MNERTGAFSPERIYPETVSVEGKTANEIRHIARYQFALQWVEPGDTVLDAGCGAGYGSWLLSEKAARVIGVDITPKAIEFAKRHYAGQKIEYLYSDVSSLSFEAGSLDCIVCIETIEHLPRQKCEALLRDVTRWLSPNGRFVFSSPMLRFQNGEPYITNPHHINEMPREVLLALFKTAFSEYRLTFFHQKEDRFEPLKDEKTGFCIIVGERR